MKNQAIDPNELRKLARYAWTSEASDALRQAADEIERLLTENDNLRRDIDRLRAEQKAAIDQVAHFQAKSYNEGERYYVQVESLIADNEHLQSQNDSVWKLIRRFAKAGREVVDFFCEEAKESGEDSVPIVLLNLSSLTQLVESGEKK